MDLRLNNPSVFLPECDTNGEYQQVQQHYGLRWCVSPSGDEIPGELTEWSERYDFQVQKLQSSQIVDTPDHVLWGLALKIVLLDSKRITMGVLSVIVVRHVNWQNVQLDPFVEL